MEILESKMLITDLFDMILKVYACTYYLVYLNYYAVNNEFL